MKKLSVIRATGEQLPLMGQNRLGVEVICGAAGSGKTSTALLRLRSLVHMYLARHERMGNTAPVRVLVLTFNRTLSGYVSALAADQITSDVNVDLEVSTFARWSREKLGRPAISQSADDDLKAFARRFAGLDTGYAAREAEYAMAASCPKTWTNTSQQSGQAEAFSLGLNVRCVADSWMRWCFLIRHICPPVVCSIGTC